MTELKKILTELCRLDIIKISLSEPYNKAERVKKCAVKPVELKGELFYQFESFTDKQAFHENVSEKQLCNKLEELLSNSFRQAQIFTPEYIYGLKISSKGKVLHNRIKNTAKTVVPEKKRVSSNNRKKNYLIDVENLPQIFKELGITTSDGKIINSKYEKFRQICRFTEIIDDVVSKDSKECFNIVDFGCGKSYLTFVVHHYFTKILGKKVKITGLDLKEDVINNCNALCEKYGISDVEFLCMDVKNYVPDRKIDMVIALHACDIATDYALYNAYLWQADYIFSAPCCQHEMNSLFKKSTEFSILSDYGLLKERFCALSTDALRCKLLEACGYSTDIVEFVDAEISPKNLIIRAVRRTKNTFSDGSRLISMVMRFDSEFCEKLCLERLVMSDFSEFTSKDTKFTLVLGKASMLVRDAVSLRKQVFGKEQNFSEWACRDELDENAWFANIYCENELVAVSRSVRVDGEPQAVLFGRIAVESKYRTFGLGSKMLLALENKARQENFKTAYVKAQTHAVEFYRKNGYEVCADKYTEGNTELLPVKKTL